MRSTCAIPLAVLLILVSAGQGAAVWIEGGAPVCLASREQRNPQAVSDGAGGAVIVWEDNRSYFSWDLYAQRISAAGDTLWEADGVPVCVASLDQIDARLMPDGSGGFFIAWTDYRNGTTNRDVFMQRVSPDGAVLWAIDGIALCAERDHQYGAEIVADDSGGVIAAWLDARTSGDRIYAQRISGDGEMLWDSSGVIISGGHNERLRILADGAGGAIVVWEDATLPSNLFAQRISGSGVVQWEINGITVCNAAGYQSHPQIAADGSGGAIIVWMDFRASAWDIYAQRISGAGAALWASNGIAVCAAENDQTVPCIVSDGEGGAIVAWVDARSGELDVYAARLNGAGVRIWPGGAVAVCTAPLAQQEAGIVPDGGGGAVIGWADRRTGFDDIYCQRMSAAGAPLWTTDGVPACAVSRDQNEPQLVSDGGGGVIAAWRDVRTSPADIYSQRILASGGTTAVEEHRIPPIRAELLPLSPNPFGGELHVRFSVDAPGGAALKVFDVKGRLVRDLGRAEAAAGVQSLVWDRRNLAGRLVKSGIYFIRLETAAGAVARKAVVLE